MSPHSAIAQAAQERIALREPIEVATPSFLVGPDVEGHWLAVETHGMGGGFFVSREAALGYARSESCHRPGAVALAAAPITLR